MAKLTVSLHPKGLPPLQAMKAWVLRMEEGLSWPEIQERTTNVLGEAARSKAIREAVARIEAMEEEFLVPKTNYGNCGRNKSCSDATGVAVNRQPYFRPEMTRKALGRSLSSLMPFKIIIGISLIY